MSNRNERIHNNPHHPSNWCSLCGLYYCWHKECITHTYDGRTRGHKFTPGKKGDFAGLGLYQEDELN